MIGGSFHTPYMEEARLELKKHIDETIFNSPVIPVCQCVDGKLNLDPEKIKNELGLSKNAFKRAVGRLLKENKVIITEKSIEFPHR